MSFAAWQVRQMQLNSIKVKLKCTRMQRNSWTGRPKATNWNQSNERIHCESRTKIKRTRPRNNLIKTTKRLVKRGKRQTNRKVATTKRFDKRKF